MNRPWNQNELDQFLRCPVTHEGLAWMDAEKLKLLNRDIEAGQVMNQVGLKLAESVDEATGRRQPWVFFRLPFTLR